MSRQRLTRTALAIAVLGALTGAPAAFAQGTGPMLAYTPDKRFMTDAAIAGMTEVEAGKLAQSKAANGDVKTFASRMVEDHAKANDKLKSIASARGVTLPGGPDKKHQDALDKLSSSKSFDKDYMDMMVKDHKRAVFEFQKQSKVARDPQLRDFAASTLPTLEEHLKMAEQVGHAR